MDKILMEYYQGLSEQRRARLKIPSECVRIWRYMDFTKFVSMLEDQALFFSRADLFEDQFEGSYPLPNLEARLTRDWHGSKKFIAFDPMKNTNNIIGRYTVDEAVQLRNYPHRLEVGKDITEEEFKREPEIHMDVDLQMRKLIPVSSEEVQRRRGGSPEGPERDEADFSREALRFQSEFFESLRGCTFINCWHVSEHESAAMWKLYGNKGASISLQSTSERLRAVLPTRLDDYGRPLDGHIDVALVQYRDYSLDKIPEGYMFDGFLYKRRSFEHEHELRAFFQDISILSPGTPLTTPSEPGRQIPVDLNKLIESIFVSPGASPMFYDLVQKVCEQYKLNKLVHTSSMEQRPLF